MKTKRNTTQITKGKRSHTFIHTHITHSRSLIKTSETMEKFMFTSLQMYIYLEIYGNNP